MVLLSGEVETGTRSSSRPPLGTFRIVLLSGEVETPDRTGAGSGRSRSSEWLCYPGKLKHLRARRGEPHRPGSGLLCYPGKLIQHGDHVSPGFAEQAPDGDSIRGS